MPEFYPFCEADDEIEAFIECQEVKKWPELSPRSTFDDILAWSHSSRPQSRAPLLIFQNFQIHPQNKST